MDAVAVVLHGLVFSTVGLNLIHALGQRSQAGRFYQAARAALRVPSLVSPGRLPGVDVVIPCFNEDPELL
jgi:hypothetical protein